MDEHQQTLVAGLGVYGFWLLKHGKKLPECPEKERLISVYKLYHKRPSDSAAMTVLMCAIDDFCDARDWEKPSNSYERAIKDYRG